MEAQPQPSRKRPLDGSEDGEGDNRKPPQKKVRFPKGKKVKPGDEMFVAYVPQPGEEEPPEANDILLGAKARSKRRNKDEIDLDIEENGDLLDTVANSEIHYQALISSMSSEDLSKKSARPELVKLNSAFKLAEKWVSNMTRTMDDKSTRVLEARPPGLGIGAVVPRQTKVALSNDPVERKLRANLEAGKRKFSKIEEENQPTPRDDGTSDEDEDESRTKAFVKKKASNISVSLPANKKHK